jgi:hypothetical protein
VEFAGKAVNDPGLPDVADLALGFELIQSASGRREGLGADVLECMYDVGA